MSSPGQIKFAKFHGAQNDYIAIDNRDGAVHMTPEQRKQMCNRHLGIGADGIFEIHRSDVADFKVMHFGSKGLVGGFCGNGTRCAIPYVSKVGIPYRTINQSDIEATANQSQSNFPGSEYHKLEREICKYGFPKNYYVFENKGGIHFGTLSDADNNFCIRCCPVDLSQIKVYKNFDFSLDTGALHHVKFAPHVEKFDVEKAGRMLANDLHQGISNVNFVSEKQPHDVSKTVLRARTYEFRVDYETMACGTGGIAIAIADVIRTMLLDSGYALVSDGHLDEMVPLPFKDILAEVGKLQDSNDPECRKMYHRRIEMRGGVLQVHFQMDNEQVHSVWLQGPAVHVMDGLYWQ